VVYLKEKKLISTFIACGDITDVQIQNGCLVIHNEDDFLINVINEGIEDIQRALSWQGLDLKVEIVKTEKELSEKEKTIQILKKFVSEDYIVEEE